MERLSASLETQKLVTSEVQTLGNKKVEEISREVTKKVNNSRLRPFCIAHVRRSQRSSTSRRG